MSALRRGQLAAAITTALACCAFPAGAIGSSGGSLLAFGSNQFGELGNTTNNGVVAGNPTPTSVSLPGGSGQVTAIAAGGAYSLVATSSGQLYSFGQNDYGQLGVSANSGTETPHPTPALVGLPAEAAGSTIASVAAGSDHTLVVTSAGQLYAFGDNYYGQLGTNTNSGSFNANPTPILLPALPGQVGQVSQVAAGLGFSLVLTSSGQLYAFGNNESGELGNTTNNGNHNPNPTPTPVPVSGQVTAIAAGGSHSLVATSSGQLYTFGQNAAGELGNPTHNGSFDPNPTPTPVALPGENGHVTELAAGDIFSLALTSSGQLYAFGANDHGQLGHTSDANAHPTPTLVTLPGQVGEITQVAASAYSSLVATSSGQLYAFGDNLFGQLGSGGGGKITTPTQVAFPAGTTIDNVARGPEAGHTLALVGDLGIATTALPPGGVGVPYSATLQVTGGAWPVTWTFSVLPPGLQVNGATIAGMPTATGTSTITVSVTDSDGLVATKQLVLTVVPGGQQPAAPPFLAHLRVAPKAFQAAGRGVSITMKSTETGATVSYTDSEAATTTFTVIKLGRGLRRGNRCVASHVRKPKGKPCVLHVKLGSLTHRDRPGANRFHFSGRLGGRKIPPGGYQLRAVPSAGGLRGNVLAVGFSILA